MIFMAYEKMKAHATKEELRKRVEELEQRLDLSDAQNKALVDELDREKQQHADTVNVLLASRDEKNTIMKVNEQLANKVESHERDMKELRESIEKYCDENANLCATILKLARLG